MVAEGKQMAALAALNATLVIIRHLSRDADTATRIAKYLDTLEYLPRLLADPHDRTDDFRQALVGLTHAHASFAFALHRFDTVTAYTW